MKILFIGHEKELNGASQSLLNIIDELVSQNEIYVLTSFGDGPFFEELSKRDLHIIVCQYYRWCVIKKSRISWIKEKIFWKVYRRFVNYYSAKKVSRIVKKEKIDIIHSNTSVINIGELIAKYSGIPHVKHIREFGDADFHMYPLINKRKYAETMNQYCDAFICISKAVYDHYYYLDKAKKYLVYNGVSTNNFILDKKYSSTTIRFLMCGRISETKGQDIAVDACQILIDKGISNFELNLAGNGELTRKHSEEVLRKINFLGYVKNVWNIRKNNDVELVCSRCEAFGRVTVEAMMSGLPVIGSNTGGTPELIINKVNGYLFQYGNANDLAEKMELFINNPDLIETCGKNAQTYALNHYTIEKCVNNISRIYDKVFQQRDN